MSDLSGTLTIGAFPSATAGVVSVPPDASLLVAQSLMASTDYSQLAVLTGERSLRGVISWESIARSYTFGGDLERVEGAMESDVIVVAQDQPLLDHVDSIADNGYVFVRDREDRITGIVTSADLTGEFAKLANPFLLIGEIEGWLREILDRSIDPAVLEGFVAPHNRNRELNGAHNLMFGEYVRIFEHPDAWEQIGLVADRKTFVAHLNDVRVARNRIMHFSPDPLENEDLTSIKNLLRWVRQLTKSNE